MLVSIGCGKTMFFSAFFPLRIVLSKSACSRPSLVRRSGVDTQKMMCAMFQKRKPFVSSLPRIRGVSVLSSRRGQWDAVVLVVAEMKPVYSCSVIRTMPLRFACPTNPKLGVGPGVGRIGFGAVKVVGARVVFGLFLLAPLLVLEATERS